MAGRGELGAGFTALEWLTIRFRVSNNGRAVMAKSQVVAGV